MQKAIQKKKIKKLLSNYNENQILFSKHCKIRMKQRGITEEEIKSILFNVQKIIFAEEELAEGYNEKKYRLVYSLSNKYNLLIVVVLKKKKIEIITCSKNMRKIWNLFPRYKI